MPDPLKNWDYVGQCFDVLKTDPIDLKQGAKYPKAFQFPPPEKFKSLPDGSGSLPATVEYSDASGGSYDQNVAEISSMYDYRGELGVDGSLTVSDPTGAAYSATVSTSYTNTEHDISNSQKIVTYTKVLETCWKLQVAKGSAGPAVGQALAKDLSQLPVDGKDSAPYVAFFDTYGTHFARAATFGGLATQRISVSRSDYETFLETGVDVRADATAEFDIAKVSGSGHVADKRSTTWKNAKSVTVDTIVYTGGTQVQQTFDNWLNYVRNSPVPVTLDLEPLYSLLTAANFPKDADVDARRAQLQKATDSYLATNGTDTSKGALSTMDEVVLSIVTQGPPRTLSAGNGKYVTTAVAPGGAPPDALRWTVVDASDWNQKEPLSTKIRLALRNCGDSSYLDAQAGSDNAYSVGDGLTGLVSSPAGSSAQWSAVLCSGSDRTEIMDGDYVQLESGWRDQDGDGYLLGESDPNDPAQRVFGFGAQRDKGAVWQVSRVSPSP